MKQFQVQRQQVRATRSIMEQNRLLQQDNAALIAIVKRQADELAELKTSKEPAKSARTKRARVKVS